VAAIVTGVSLVSDPEKPVFTLSTDRTPSSRWEWAPSWPLFMAKAPLDMCVSFVVLSARSLMKTPPQTWRYCGEKAFYSTKFFIFRAFHSKTYG
jgi:hypothetical protein